MQWNRYSVDWLAADLRAARACARDERELLGHVEAIAQRAVSHRSEWLRPETTRPDIEQGFGFHLIHEEHDHSLAVFVASWLAQRGTPPHDHGTWAVVAGLDGSERNTLWRRVDDRSRPGLARLAKLGDTLIGPGQLLAMPEGAIHSVHNDSHRVTVSLHIYGRHVNHTHRSRFDPERETEAPYQVITRGEAHPHAARTTEERDNVR